MALQTEVLALGAVSNRLGADISSDLLRLIHAFLMDEAEALAIVIAANARLFATLSPESNDTIDAAWENACSPPVKEAYRVLAAARRCRALAASAKRPCPSPTGDTPHSAPDLSTAATAEARVSCFGNCFGLSLWTTND